MNSHTENSASERLPKSFWFYVVGLALAALGDAVMYIALPFLALSLVQGGAAVGVVGSVVLAGSLPRLLGPLLGGLADRTAPRLLLVWTPLVRATFIAAVAGLGLRGLLTLPVLLALAFLSGLLSTLTYTAGSALLPRLVPAGALVRANSLQSGALMGLPLIGYGLGGVLVDKLGANQTLLVSAPLVLMLALAATFLPKLSAAGAGEKLHVWRDLALGAAVLKSRPLVVALFSASFVLNVGMNLMNVRSPVFMGQFGRGAPDYSIFEMLISGGVLLGILLVGPLSQRVSLDTLIGWSRWVLVLGSAGFVVSLVPVWWGAALVFGVGLGALEVLAMTRSQQLIPPEVRGRVLGALLSANAVGLSLGAALAATPTPTPLLMAGLTLTLALLGLFWPLALLGDQRVSASSSASAKASSSSSQG